MNPAIPLRILHTESSINWGGQEDRTLAEVRWLRSRGHMAWIACDPESEMFRRAGPELCVPVRMRRSVDPLASEMLRRFCRENDVQLVHTHSSRDSWVCYPLHLGRVPVVRSRQITNPVRPSLDRSFIYRHGCARLIVTADCIRRTFVSYTRVEASRIEVIGEGTDTKRFNPKIDGRAVRRELGLGDDAVVFGLVAMLRPEKGHRHFIEAALRVSASHAGRARFLIVGGGVGDCGFEKECRALLDQRFGSGCKRVVTMTGFRSDMPEVMAALDVLVVPSLADAQTLVVPQAFATGRPVIASRVGGLPELVAHEKTGLLVEPGCVVALAAAMTRMIEEEALRLALGRRARVLAQAELSFDRKMQQCVALYRRVVGEKKKVPAARKAVRSARTKWLRNAARRLPVASLCLMLIVALSVAGVRTPWQVPSAPGSAGDAAGASVLGARDDRGVSQGEILSHEDLAPLKYSTDDARIIG